MRDRTAIALAALLAVAVLGGGCAKKQKQELPPTPKGPTIIQSDGKKEDLSFLLGTKCKVARTQMRIRGQTHDVAVVTLWLGIENNSSEPVTVDIRSNIVPIHPKMQDKRNVFALLQKNEGPYLVEVKPNATKHLNVRFIQKPQTPDLTDHILVLLPSIGHTQRVGVERESP